MLKSSFGHIFSVLVKKSKNSPWLWDRLSQTPFNTAFTAFLLTIFPKLWKNAQKNFVASSVTPRWRNINISGFFNAINVEKWPTLSPEDPSPGFKTRPPPNFPSMKRLGLNSANFNWVQRYYVQHSKYR